MRRRWLAVLGAAWAAAATASEPSIDAAAATASELSIDAAAPTASEPVVILISLDGVRHDQPDRATLPALDRLAREGLRADRLEPVAPASTFPAHVSLATGAPPARHGIVDNRFWDPERGDFDYSNDASWIQAEPLWAAAERQGLAAATFFWVGSESDWRGRGARYRRAPFDTRIGPAEKVEQILAWLDLPPPERPRLVMSWWHGSDRAGHRYGPDDARVDAALAAQDTQLAGLLAGLDARGAWSSTTLVVVSDHGMTSAEHSIPLDRRLREAGLDPRVVKGSAVAHLFFADPDEIERAERALADLEGLLLARRAALPAGTGLAHPTRSGDLIARALPGFTFRARGLGSALLRAAGRGSGLHGYAVPHPDMPGIFYARGRCAPAGGRVGSVDSLDVAASVAMLLGMEPPLHSQGRPVPALRHGPCAPSPTAAPARSEASRFARPADGT